MLPTFSRPALAGALSIAFLAGCSQGSNNASQASSATPSGAATTGAAGVTEHVRGTISKVSATSLTITTAQGPVVVLGVGPATKVAGVVPATRDDIKPNTFIGSANVPNAAGNAQALEVVVFPDSLRGTGEGDYAWDLPPKGGGESSMTNGTVLHGSSMTNGTVSSGSAMTNGTVSHGSAMTNGTVSSASTNGAMTVTLNYKGGSKRLTIPAGVPVVRVVPASRAALVPGAHVFAVVPQGANPTALRIIVGEHGTVPPM